MSLDCLKQMRPTPITHWQRLAATALLLVLGTLQATAMTMPTTTTAQQVTRKGKRTRPPREAEPTPPSEASESQQQIAALSRQVAELSQQLAALTAKSNEATEARRALAELEARVQAAEERALRAERSTLALRAELAQTGQVAKAAESKIESVTSTLKATQTGLKDTQAKLDKTAAQTAQAESTLKRIGPIRLSGDFRLRADAILRSSLAHPKPEQTALPHLQNIRLRYRLRLNLDTDVHSWVAVHSQLTTGPANNSLTMDQDFGATVVRHPFFISEAWVDFHPTKWLSLQGGRVREVFADNTRFLFDNDVRFNGFNERLTYKPAQPVAGLKSVELRAGQYIFTHPNLALVTPENLGPTGAKLGAIGRGAQMFHQGLLFNQQVSAQVSQQFVADIQLYRNPNQLQFASTEAGLPIVVQNNLGLVLSGPVTQGGNATTTPGGASYTARHYQVARLGYQLDYLGLGQREHPISFNLQVARNVGTGQRERDALLTSLSLGEVKKRGDQSFRYVFAIKGANSMLAQVTDSDLGTLTGVNIRTHHFRHEIGLGKGIEFQSLFFIQNVLRSSGQYPNFFVPFNAYTPRQYRIMEQLSFTF